MAKREARTHPAAFLGDELRRARIDAGFTSQDALAAEPAGWQDLIADIKAGRHDLV